MRHRSKQKVFEIHEAFRKGSLLAHGPERISPQAIGL